MKLNGIGGESFVLPARSCREMTPFSFLSAIARYVRRSATPGVRRFACHSRPRSACSKQLTVMRASARGMKRGRSWNNGGGRGSRREKEREREREKASVLYYLPRSTARRYCSERCDTFSVTAAPRPLDSRRETWSARRIVSRRRLTLTITYCLELSIYGTIYAPDTPPNFRQTSDPRYPLLELYTRLQNFESTGLTTIVLKGERKRNSRSFILHFFSR